jgi:transposase
VDEAERPVLRKKLRRRQVLVFFAKLEPTRVGLEACGGAHYWARELRALGHEVVLLPPQYVKPYVKRGKNDAADAEAICEAMSRRSMRFVPVKTAEQQAAQMLAGIRDRLVRRRTQLSNAIRGYAAEFGLTAAKGLDKIEPLLGRIESDPVLPALAKELFGDLAREFGSPQVFMDINGSIPRGAKFDDTIRAALADCNALTDVGLSMTKITNDVFEYLDMLPNLTEADLSANRPITTEAVLAFEKAHPQCDIEWYGE